MRLRKIRLKYDYFFKSLLGCYTNYIVIRQNFTEFYLAYYNLSFFFNFFKNSSFFSVKILVDIAVTDQVQQFKRFKISYNCLSLLTSFRYIINILIEERTLLNSLSKIFKSANWAEREAWDMYGVYFLNHNDLRRILTDYGFRGFPFRKDFPLTGYIELRFDDSKGDIVYEPVELAQEMRFFNFSTGWEVD